MLVMIWSHHDILVIPFPHTWFQSINFTTRYVCGGLRQKNTFNIYFDNSNRNVFFFSFIVYFENSETPLFFFLSSMKRMFFKEMSPMTVAGS